MSSNRTKLEEELEGLNACPHKPSFITCGLVFTTGPCDRGHLALLAIIKRVIILYNSQKGPRPSDRGHRGLCIYTHDQPKNKVR